MNSLPFHITVAQINIESGNIKKNLSTILDAIASAKKNTSKMIVFPELSTCGYLLGDRFEYDAFIKEIEQANETIKKHSIGIVVVFGTVVADWNAIGEDGRVRKYNAVCIAHEGRWVSNGVLDGFIPKTNLPKYRIFDDARHFYPALLLAQEKGISLNELLQVFSVSLDDKKYSFALSVCEDLWEDEYNTKPSLVYKDQHPDLLIDVSQSPWTLGKWKARLRMLKKRATESNLPILYVNSVGLQNNGKNLVLFDGSSCLFNEKGNQVWQADTVKDGLYTITPSKLRTPITPFSSSQKAEIKELHDALVYAMKQFYAPFKKVIVGLSGGIDSALALTLLVEALGSDRVLTVNMPSAYNSSTTKSLAKECAKRLKVTYTVFPITTLYEEELRLLESSCATSKEVIPMLVKENIQARLRGHILAAIAGKEGGVFTNNGNKTEVALNYFTLYGDAAGAAAFLGDIWKGQVYALARYCNTTMGNPIPKGILTIVPSAELSPEQNVDEGKGDPIFYEYHDALLRLFTERRCDPTVVLREALCGYEYVEELLMCKKGVIATHFKSKAVFVQNLEWAWRQYNTEFKRVQLPPVFLTSRRAFGFDRRDTIADAYFTKEYEMLKKKFLQK